ncbi:MAG TPA: 30S ribosomal protein S12 methylthiotransferase RimO [Actinomycetota bacterium]|jgi:ribosomal protein S12 methylthiotransferase|nr:30S ribosomal protein S12 methylthiotransferase RimO [Actinomycetota bacterium]
MSKVAIVTLGCPKNAVDSEGLGGLLAAGGHEVSDSAEGADVVLVNTCGFIDPARRETVEEVLEYADLKEAGDLKGIVLAGCLVARSAGELAGELPEVDALVDFAAYPRIADIVAGVASGSLGTKIHGAPGTRFDPAYWDATIAASPRLRFGVAPWAYVKIAEGCDRGCTFCAIPLMRGKFRSRAAAGIEEEVRGLAAQGVTEISLVSQDSVMWGRDTGEGSFVDLLRRLERVEGIRRIRLMYLHPQGVTEELLETVLSSDVICHYFDLSLQHVAPKVLSRMGRWGSRRRFDSLVARIRGADPLAGVRATFILGFPGEHASEAREVESFVADAELDWIGVFTYSPEEGTRGALLPDQVDPATARERADRVTAIADAAMERRARALVGERLEVLAERYDLSGGAWYGRSHREAPEVDGEILMHCAPDLRVGDYVIAEVVANDGADLEVRVTR